jgi:hypothetical protein
LSTALDFPDTGTGLLMMGLGLQKLTDSNNDAAGVHHSGLLGKNFPK